MTRRQLLDERRSCARITPATVLLAVLLFLHLAYWRLDSWLARVDLLLDGPGPSSDPAMQDDIATQLDQAAGVIS